MKTSKAIALMMMALALCAMPAVAQRPGGGHGGGGGHSSHSSSMGSSRSSSSSHSSYSGSSRSSSPSSSRSYSAPSSSRSSSSHHSSVSAPSRSHSSAPSHSSSVGAPSRHSAPGATRSASHAPSRSGVHEGAPSRHSDVRQAPATRGAREAGVTSRRGVDPGVSRRDAPAGGPRMGARKDGPTPGGRVSSGRANDVSPYARPGRPGGVMPPSHRPIHPAPYFHHPYHHRMVHCHPIFWDPIPPRPWYWPGFWLYCNSYWYDYHVTDVVVVHDYVQSKYNVDLVTYGISGDIMYAIVRDGGDTYLQVYDKDDHLLAEQKINRKYCNMVIDSDNGGCWISKKNEKDPLLFIWADGQLLIYEED